MEAYYTKAKPKVVDYNPLTHIPFYSQSSSPSPYPVDYYKKTNWNNYSESPVKHIRATSLAGKNIFSQSSQSTNRFQSKADINGNNDSPRLYKTRPKNKIVDPISGEVKVFNINRPRIENLDLFHYRDKLDNNFNNNSMFRLNDRKNIKPMNNIAGSLRKEVPYVSYVNPIMLNSNY